MGDYGRVQMSNNGALGQAGSLEGKKWLYMGHTLKVKPIEFANKLE